VLARSTLLRLGAALALSAAVACGGGAGATANLTAAPAPYVITILNDTFLPADLPAPPGATVLVRNDDSFDHWVQSAAAPGEYVYGSFGGVSIYLRVPARTEQAFDLPAAVAVGTVVPYFCADMGSAMLPGTITIVAPTTASAPPDTGRAR
jgi:hypothetical protein